MQPVRLLVCGEPMRGDDGVAFEAVRALSPELRRRVDVVPVGQLMPEHLVEAGDVPVIVIDAVIGPPAGTVVEVPLADLASLSGATPRSSHALSPATTVALVESLLRRQLLGRFVGLAGESFGPGHRPSTAVRSGMDAYVTRIGCAIEELSQLDEEAPAVEPAAP